ncbi:MAG TPA: SRPBCC family protein [Candidatus Limnocylindria bacterium]|nr:SRPBCC family protein [Candidatus Limnocylindria bacterium]
MRKAADRSSGGPGRRLRPLGPQVVRIDAPRDLVFAQIAVPYRAVNPPRELRAKIEVLERGAETVIAAHRTRVGCLTVVTVESVTFSPPDEIRFRLLRGPVPFVSERFFLRETADGVTELEYTGELGTNLWAAGEAWGSLVARHWERTVAIALRTLKASAETMAARAAARRLGSARSDRGERVSER